MQTKERGRRNVGIPSRRTRRILEAAKRGLSYEEIGRRLGVTGRRVGHIARQWGLPARRPVKRIHLRCRSCSKPITTLVTAPRKFCSKKCFYLSRRGPRLPINPLTLAARKRVCKYCKKEFLAGYSRQDRKFCSKRCAGRARSRLAAKDLVRMRVELRADRTYREVASRFGVTRQYVHSLARIWDLTRRKRRA